MTQDQSHLLHRQQIIGGCRAIIAGIFIHFTLGALYTWGNLQPYIASYMRNVKHLDIRVEDLSFVFSAGFSGIPIGMIAGGIIETSLGPRIAVYIGGSIFVLAVFSSALMLHSYIGFILLYGGLFGVGLGICYTSPLSCAFRWLPHKKGLITGFITAALGSSALVLSLIQTRYINPDNLEPVRSDQTHSYFTDEALLGRVPLLILYSSIVYLIFLFIGGTLLIDPPSTQTEQLDEEGLQPTNLIDELPITDVPPRPSLFHAKMGTEEPENNLSPFQAFTTSRFLLLFFLFFLVSPATTFSAAQWKSSPSACSLDDKHLSILGAVASVCNGVGRIIWGMITDRFTTAKAFLILTSSWTVNLISLAFLAPLASVVYNIAICANFFFLGGTFVMFPSFTSIAFGRRFLGTIYGVLFLSQMFGSNFSSFVTQQYMSTFGYSGLCCFYSGLVLIACLSAAASYSSLNSACRPHSKLLDSTSPKEDTALLKS